MKVIHLSSSNNGGAGIAASRINECIQKKTIFDSKIIFDNDPGIKNQLFWFSFFQKSKIKKIKRYVSKNLNKLQGSPNPIKHSLSFLPSFFDQYLNNSKNDIVHLHWIQNEMLSIEEIGRIKKPIVWTLHDTWSFCGSEHYPNGFDDIRFKNSYSKTSRPKNHNKLDLDRWCWLRKKHHWKKNFYIVCPSHWMANFAKESSLMKNMDISVIPNPIDTELFKPIPKKISRDLFKIPIDKKVILFGAVGALNDKRKGSDLLLKALDYTSKEISDAIILIFGDNKKYKDIKCGIPIYRLGNINDKQSLSCLYSAADLFVLPSRMDNLPNTGIEASACGIPLVAFNTSGLSDIVIQNENGFLIDKFNYKEMGRAITNILNNQNLRRKFSLNSRNIAINSYSYEKISNKYIHLYKRILSS